MESMNQHKSHTRGLVVFILGVLLALLLFLHAQIPTAGGLALVIESALPWAWVLVALLIIAGLIRFSFLGILGFLIPAVVWASMFGGYLRPAGGAGDVDLNVVTQNVGAKLAQPTATANKLIAQDPDVITVQELASKSGKIIRQRLNGAFTYSQVTDTIGVWSKYRLSAPQEISLGLKWPRAFKTTFSTAKGKVSMYVVHMPSVRIGDESTRDSALEKLAGIVKQDSSDHIIMAGDFNAGGADRYLAQLTAELDDSRAQVGGGFGFTWPARFPVVRLDHVLSRGFTVKHDAVLDAGTSDHRAVSTQLDFA